jgi:hypothetical protein
MLNLPQNHHLKNNQINNMPKTYEYNGETFTHEDMLEAYGDDAGVQNAVKQFGIKEQGNDQDDIPQDPGKKKTVVARGATATVTKGGASKKVTGSSVSPKQTPSSFAITPGVSDFGAKVAGDLKQQGFKELGQTPEYKKQQAEKNKALKEQQDLDQAKMEARNAASAERLRKKSEVHIRFIQSTKPKEEQILQLDDEIQRELKKDGTDQEYMVYPKNEFSRPRVVKNKYNAFSLEKAEVIAELKKNQTYDKHNEDSIRQLAAERYKKKKIASIYDTNAKDFMEDITSEEQEELRKASEEASKNASKQVNYNALLNQRHEKNINGAMPKLKEYYDGLQKYDKDYKFKSKEEYQEYKQKLQEYNFLRSNVLDLQTAQQENLKSLDKSKESLLTAEQEFDVFKRHYGAGNLILKPAAAFKSLLVDAIGFGSLMFDYASMPSRYIYSKTIGDDDFEYVSGATKAVAEYGQESEEFWSNYFQKTVEITDSESLGEYSFDLVANQLPNFLLMALSGGGSTAARVAATEVVGKTIVEQTAKSTLKKAASWTVNKMALQPNLQLMAAGGTGGKYLENVRSNDIGETNYNPIQMVASSLLWGYAEALGEKVTVDILKGSGRTLEALLKGDTNFVQKTLKQKSVDFFRDKGIDFVNENVSEQATNLVQNSVNKFILGQNVGLLDNTGRVFKDTSLLAGMMQTSPHIIGAAIKPFLPKDETATIKDNALKIAKYMNLLQNDKLSFEESTVIEKKIKDLTDNSSEIMKGLIKRIGDMPPSDYDKVINLSKELADLKTQATNIYNSDSSNKEQLIKDLKETHDSKKKELNKLVQETKILSKLDGNYTVQEKRDLYDLEIQAKNLEKEIEGKDGAEVLVKKEQLKQIREKQNNIALNSMITTQAKGVGAINEILKSKGLSGIEVVNATTEQEAIEQHDKIVDKLVEAGELTEAKAKAQKSIFLQTIKSAEAAKTTINKTDYVFNIKDRIDNEAVFAHEPGHATLDRLISQNPEDYKEIHDALLDHVKTLFGKSTRQNEKNALEYILAGVKAYQQHAIDTKQDYAYDELLQVVGDALQKYNIGMESMDPTFLQRLGEKIKEFLRRVLKIQNVDDIVKFDTGKDVYDFIKEYRRTFRKGELSKGLKASLEKGSIEGKLVKKQTKPTRQKSKPSLDNVSKYISESKPRGLSADISNDLLYELNKDIEDYWGKVSDGDINSMYQAVEEAKNIIEERSKDSSSIMKSLNESLNLETLKSLEVKLNNISKNVNVKPSLTLVSNYITENKKRKLSIDESNDLLEDLYNSVEDYWGELSNENIGVIYQNIEYAKDVIEERASEKNPMMQSFNEALNLETVKSTETRINNIINGVSAKASLAFNRLNLQTEKRELIKVNTDIASKYKSGQVKSQEDQDTINKNIERVRVINDILSKPEGEAIKGVSEKNQKISEKNAALLKVFKDINTDPRTREKIKMDLLGNNMGIIVNLVKRYWSYQQEETAFTKDDLKEELILQFFNMLNTYDPVKNPNFGAYIGGYLPKRIPRILENIGTIKTKAGEERVFGDTLSDEGSKQLSEEEENEYIEDVKANKKRLSEALNISQDIIEEINKTAIRALGGRIGDITSNEFKTKLRQNIRADLRNVLNRDFGVSISYAAYLNKNWKILYDAIPLSVMNKRFQEFREPVLGPNGKQLEEQIKKDGKSWRLKVWKKSDISQEDFFGYFVGQYIGKSTQGTRKTALLETIAEELSFDVMIDLFTNNEEFKANFEEKQELLGNELAPNYLSEIAKQLDRDTPNTKASLWGKKFLEDNNLSKEQGINILESISKDLSKGREAESVFNKFRKLLPDFVDFIDYFYNKVKNYITQGKLDKNKKEARKYNEGLVEKSNKFSKDQIKKMSDEDLNEEINNINTKQKAEAPSAKASLSLSGRFNQILEEKSGIKAKRKLSEATAYVEGRGKGRFKFFIPPNTEDFVGLLYTFLPFGKNGERAMEFFHDNLVQPFYDAMNSYDKEKMQMVKDYKELKNIFNMKNSYLRSTIPNMNYTVDQAIRLWIWHMHGEDIQGIPEVELRKVIAFVRKNKELKLYAQELSKITKRKGGYVEYDKDWLGGTISTDIIDYLNSERRAYHLQLWQANADEIFNNENLNKIQAIYGLNYRRALVNSLARMKSGKNRTPGSDAESSAWLDFINGANANIMFLNTRSALLQLTATMNYIDMDINNPITASKAFADQKQFWKDFIMLWNEDYLVERRGGARFDVSADEIATQASGKNGFKKLLAKLNEAGFAPTKYADSISASLGGASFYRTHYNHYVNIGYSQEEAHLQAILEWAERTETTNQSARPDKVSQIQSTSIGRLIFAFGNTSFQYNRLMKRAFLDIVNKRGDWKKNAGKIIYYGAINNMIFSFLQNALFASIFGEDDEEKNIYEDQALASTIDGIVDSLLKGSGIYGAILSTAKNMWQKWYEMELSGRKNPYEVPLEVLSISPAISSKVNKLVSASRTFIYKQEKEKMEKAGWSIKNPAYGAAAKVLSVTTNIPADRVFQKIENLRLASDSSLEGWQRTMLLLGYNKYNLGIEEESEPIDVLSKSERKTFEQYKDIEPTLTEEQYMEMKDLEPKVKPARKKKKTWLNIFNPNLERDMAKDPLTKAQRKTFEKYKEIEPTLTVKDFIEMNNISIREGSNVEEFEKISQELEQIKAQEEETIDIKNKEE